MRRLLATWIALALAAGAVVAVRGDEPEATAHYLPDILPVGFTLHDVAVAQPGATLATTVAPRRMLLRRPGDRISVTYVALPADPDGRGATRVSHPGSPRPFGDGTAFVDGAGSGTWVWWTTSRRSGTLWSRTIGATDLLELAHGFDATGRLIPAGWKGLQSFDPDSATEVLRYTGPEGPATLHVDVHRDRRVVRTPTPEQSTPYAQHQLGDAVVTVVSTADDSGLRAADLQAVADSVRRVDEATWRAATGRDGLDGRAVRWEQLAAGRASTNAGWSLAVEHRDGQRCVALLVTERASGARGQCNVANWRTDPVLAVPTDRSGPVTVTANGRPLRALGHARFDGRRILVVELPADLWGQVIDPVAVVSRR